MITDTKLQLRIPTAEDGRQVWDLIRRAGTLDLNSPYCYIMWSDHFSDTSVIAEENGEMAGFVSAYRSPRKENTLFVWQVAVAPSYRRRGLGKAMIKDILKRESCQDILHFEATVGLSNTASRQLFVSLAKEYNTQCHTESGYEGMLFPPDSEHETEKLLRVGPIRGRFN